MKNIRIVVILAAALLICCSVALSEAFRLPDTGQTKCYQGVEPYAEIPCTGTGQDGVYNINPLSYTDNGNGTVTDDNTGLMWQKCSVGQNNDATCTGDPVDYNWYQAAGVFDATYNPSLQNVCRDVTLSGQSDWRLPSKKELISIVDYSIPYPGPAINTAYFPTTHADFYWSSTPYAGYPSFGLAWGVSFGNGSVYYNYKDGSGSVRCVRGEQLDFGNYVDNQDGTVTDSLTGLMVQQSEPGLMTWQGALDYCNGLDLADLTDWRLPNVKELESLTDDTKYNPAIDTTFFPNAYASLYWSSTTYVDNLYYTLREGVYFFDGYVASWDNVGSAYVRCVRGGQLLANLIVNPDFDTGTLPWKFYTNGVGTFANDAAGPASAKAAHVTITTPGTNVQLYQAGLVLEANTKYRLRFKAYSNTRHDLQVALLKNVTPFANYGLKKTFNIGTAWNDYSIEFTTSGFSGTVTNGRLMFYLAPYAASGDEYFLDDVVLEAVEPPPPSTPNLVTNGGFDSGKPPWLFWTDETGGFSVIGDGGNNIARVGITTPGTNVQLYQDSLALEANTRYRLTFWAYSNTGDGLQVVLLKNVTPFINYGMKQVFDLTNTWQPYAVEFITSGFAGTVNDGRLMFYLAPYAAAGDEYFFEDVVLEKVLP